MNDDRLARVLRDALAERRPASSRDFVARLHAASRRTARPRLAAPAMLALAVAVLALVVLLTRPSPHGTPPMPPAARGDRARPAAHDGKYTDCAPCHSTKSFPHVRAIHDVGDFSLTGAHEQLACARCHPAGARLRGSGNSCITCHRRDDIHRGRLSPRCGGCHTQRAWVPPR